MPFFAKLLLCTSLLLCGSETALAYEGGRFAKEDPPAHKPVLTKAPTLLHFEAAKYPESQAGRGKVEVTLVLTIDAQGHVTKSTPSAETPPTRPLDNAQAAASAPVAPTAERIVLSTPSVSLSEFVAAAQAAASKLTFTPAEVDNKPSPIVFEFRYTFSEDLPAAQPASAPTTDGARNERAQISASEPVVPSGTAVIRGEIREAGTRLRIAGVNVRVEIGDRVEERITDERGTFLIDTLPAGQAKLVVAALRYRRLAQSVKLEAHVETGVRYYLQREVLDPFETTVRTKKESNEVTRRVISREELRVVPGSVGDPLRVIQDLPGVARPPLFGGQLIIRGSAPGDSLVYFNGMELPALYHFLQGPSVLPERMVEDVTFIPGNFGVRYGRATAGIVDVRSRDLDSKRWTGLLSVDTGIASLFIEAPVSSDTHVAVAARRSYIDAVLPLVLPKTVGNVASPILAPVFWDYQVDIMHRTKNLGDFQLLVYGSDDRLKFVQAPSQSTSTFDPTSLQIILQFHSIQPRWTFKLSPQVTNTMTAVGTYQQSSANTPDVFYSLQERKLGFRNETEAKLVKGVSLLFGVDTQLDDFALDAHLPLFPQFVQFPNAGTQAPAFSDIRSHSSVWDVALYGELSIDWGKWRFVPGVRIEENGYLGNEKQAIEPRFTARYKWLDNLTLKAGVGLYQKAPDPTNLISGIGNPQLELQDSMQISVGQEWNITPAISLETTTYFNYLWSQVASTSDVIINSNGSVTPVVFNNSEIGRTYGLEVLLRHRPYKNFFGWVSYTLSRSERKDPTSDWYLFAYDQTHILTLVGSYILPYGFTVGARFRLVSGNPTTPVRRAVYDADTGAYARVNGPSRSDRLPAFNQLDIRIDKKFTFNTWTFGLYADIQNVYNASNPEFVLFYFDYSKKTYVNGLPFLPFIGMQGEF